MVKQYELYVILDPEVAAEKRTAEIAKLQEVIKNDFGGESIKTDDQGAKKLAYPIGKSRLGHYILFTFELAFENAKKISGFEKKMNVSDIIVRYILVDMTSHNALKLSESRNKKTEITNHLELNKGRITTKKDVVKHLGIKSLDYKEVEFLEQFTSPYHKLFNRKRMGNSAKTQRMVSQAVKRARHMALMAFTPRHDA